MREKTRLQNHFADRSGELYSRRKGQNGGGSLEKADQHFRRHGTHTTVGTFAQAHYNLRHYNELDQLWFDAGVCQPNGFDSVPAKSNLVPAVRQTDWYAITVRSAPGISFIDDDDQAVDQPIIGDVKMAISEQKNCKASGKDEISVEWAGLPVDPPSILKVWEDKEMPTGWMDGLTRLIYKREHRLQGAKYRRINFGIQNIVAHSV